MVIRGEERSGFFATLVGQIRSDHPGQEVRVRHAVAMGTEHGGLIEEAGRIRVGSCVWVLG